MPQENCSDTPVIVEQVLGFLSGTFMGLTVVGALTLLLPPSSDPPLHDPNPWPDAKGEAKSKAFLNAYEKGVWAGLTPWIVATIVTVAG